MEFTHICGLSAAGKRTLIGKLVKSSHVRRRFGLTGEFRLFGPKDNEDPPLLFCSPEYMLEFGHQGEHRLHKWQFLSHDLILQLREKFPNAIHRVILVWRPFELIRDAIHERSRKTDEWWPTNEDLEKQWWEKIVPKFKMLKDNLVAVTVVDGSTDDYDDADDRLEL